MDTREQLITALQTAGIEENAILPQERLVDYSQDFGRLEIKMPAAVIAPISAQDIAVTLQVAREFNLPVTVRGAAHTTGGQTLSENGIVLDLKMLQCDTQIISTDDGFVLETFAGNYWSEVIRETIAQGYTPPAYSDWLHLTVGGTVCTGGVGQSTFKKGCQTDNVVALEIVTPIGEILWCNAEENIEIFNAARGGLGLFGVITKIQMKLEIAPAKVVVAKVLFEDVGVFLDGMQRASLSEAIDGIQAHVEPRIVARVNKRVGDVVMGDGASLAEDPTTHIPILEVTQYVYDDADDEQLIERFSELLHELFGASVLSHIYVTDFVSHISRVPPILDPDLEDEQPGHHHACFFMPMHGAQALLEEQYQHYSPEQEGLGTTLIIPMKRSAMDNQTSLMVPNENDLLFVGFLRRQVTSQNTAEQLTEMNATAHDAALARCGKHYICGSLKTIGEAREYWREHFGVARYRQLSTLREQLGAHGLFGEGVGFVDEILQPDPPGNC